MLRTVWMDHLNPDAAELRQEVFTLEQGFKEEEDVDQIDSWAHNLTIYDDDIAVATARVFLEQGSTYHVGRLCVKQTHRSKGLGSLALTLCKEKALSLGATKLRLGAQYDKADFYIKNGYKVESPDYFDDGGYLHVYMYMDL
ncbi:MAG: GNAT family N-acetyltransferase [Bacilli bacterium]|nr:GNAT family N-acetyltransferase [Bacilli bacterium]